MNLSIIIPSRNVSNLHECVRAVRMFGEFGRVIVIDDGLDPAGLMRSAVFTSDKWITDFYLGRTPFIFARNVNIGIRAAERDDVILLNDDALLRTGNGFSVLAAAASAHAEYGVIASTCNNVGNTNQYPRGNGYAGIRCCGLREEPRMVCFTAVLIPRRTIDVVGLLDEDFGGPGVYGFEDDAYCLRVRRAGLKIGIHDGCFVDHGSLPSTFRSGNMPDLSIGQEIFVKKFGGYPL